MAAVHPSVERLHARLTRIPDHLRSVLAGTKATTLSGDVVVTGIGAAAGPARYLAWLLGLPGFAGRARFVAPSAFVTGVPADGRTLVVFSQHLSPNARLVLARARRAMRVVVITSATRAEVEAAARAPAPLDVVELPPRQPEEERGTLLRVEGPAVASFFAALLARDAGVPLDAEALARVPDVVASAGARLSAACDARALGAAIDGPLAIVTTGPQATARAAAWKILEGWSAPEPPVWDVLEVAHGPFQQLYAAPACLVVLERRAAEDAELVARLVAMLAPERHALVRLASELPEELAPLEHDALVDALVLAGLRARPRDLEDWDGKGRDGPLYDLDR